MLKRKKKKIFKVIPLKNLRKIITKTNKMYLINPLINNFKHLIQWVAFSIFKIWVIIVNLNSKGLVNFLTLDLDL